MCVNKKYHKIQLKQPLFLTKRLITTTTMKMTHWAEPMLNHCCPLKTICFKLFKRHEQCQHLDNKVVLLSLKRNNIKINTV